MGDMADDLERSADYAEQELIDADAALDERISIIKDRYTEAKLQPIHAAVSCGYCNRKFQKKVKAQAFCSRHCKDAYWNTVDENRRYRAVIFSGGRA